MDICETNIIINDRSFKTLEDILPQNSRIKCLVYCAKIPDIMTY